MSQLDVLKVLESKPTEWMNVNQIQEELGIRNHNIQTSLKKLRKFNIVDWDKVLHKDESEAMAQHRWLYLYKHKEKV